MQHRLFYKTTHRFFQENYSIQAAGLTFYTLFALAPLVTLGLSLIAWVSVIPDQAAHIEAFFLNHFVPKDSDAINYYIHTFVESTAKLSRISTIIFLLTVIFLVSAIERCFNHIWRVKAPVFSMRQFFHYTMVLVVSPLLVGLSVGLSIALLSLKWLQHPIILSGIADVVKLLPFVLTWLALTVLYYWLPQTEVKFKNVSVAAFIVAILFEFMKYAFQLYVILFPTYQIVYGALALLPIFLLWIYFSWVVVLWGAIFAYELGHHSFSSHLGK